MHVHGTNVAAVYKALTCPYARVVSRKWRFHVSREKSGLISTMTLVPCWGQQRSYFSEFRKLQHRRALQVQTELPLGDTGSTNYERERLDAAASSAYRSI